MTIRHGDVLLRVLSENEAIPQDAVKLDGRRELAYGEVTGHAHRINVGDLFQSKDGGLYLRAEKLTEVSHEEHTTRVIPAGDVKVWTSRQYNPETGWEKTKD